MEKKGWKILAIIFIIISILEFSSIVWAWNYATDSIEKENECMYNICSGYDTYYFDDFDSMCFCTRGEETYQEYIK